MKIGDLLISRNTTSEGPVLIVLKIIKHPDDSARDRIRLQWMSRNGGKSVKGELSRYITEKKYTVV